MLCYSFIGPFVFSCFCHGLWAHRHNHLNTPELLLFYVDPVANFCGWLLAFSCFHWLHLILSYCWYGCSALIGRVQVSLTWQMSRVITDWTAELPCLTNSIGQVLERLYARLPVCMLTECCSATTPPIFRSLWRTSLIVFAIASQ
jgi:hypothetical protein